MKRVAPLQRTASVVINSPRKDTTFQIGDSIWLPADDHDDSQTCFIQTRIEDILPDRLKGRSVDNHIFTLAEAHHADTHFDLCDNAELQTLNYANVLQNICVRFQKAAADETERHAIYTYAGWVLFAVNPFYNCEELYSPAWCERYFRKSIGQEPPHPFAISATAFSRLISDKESQYILVSGESGSGKTECSKHVLRYLTWVTRRQRRLRGRASIDGPGDVAEALAHLLLAANPILEFFGNAKTARNDNSSRFGKLFQIYYDQNGEKLITAELCTYLLAKSRVVQVPNAEENYHVFHALQADPYLRDILGWDEDFDSPYLGDNAFTSRSNHYDKDGPFHISRLQEAMKTFDIDMETQVKMFRILFGIVMLGRLDFEAESVDSATVITNNEDCVKICRLWDMPDDVSKKLETVLTSKQIRDTRQRLNPSQAQQMTGALAKGLYEALFDHLVATLRGRLRAEGDRFKGSGDKTDYCVGVLDLFGFENMEPSSSNGFEQLCINYANEELHSHFLRQVVARERELYANEGVQIGHADFENTDLTSEALSLLLSSKSQPGVFGILDEVSRVGGGDKDGTFCRRVVALIDINRKRDITSPTKKRRIPTTFDASAHGKFTISHFAENVTYNADGFAARNQDHISDELRSFLAEESGPFIRELFEKPPTGEEGQQAVRKIGGKSLSSMFIKQMSGVIGTLDTTSCYFIKCLKPNEHQEPFTIVQKQILRQLVTGGVGPVLEVMGGGFPCRLSYESLWMRYRDFLSQDLLQRMNPRDFAELTMGFLRVPKSDYRLGASKVFFRFGALQRVEALMERVEDDFQSSRFAGEVQRYFIKSRLDRVLSAVDVLVRLCHNVRRLRLRRVARDAAEAYWTIYVPKRRARMATRLQRWIRASKHKIRQLRQRRAALKIQQWAAHEWIIRFMRRVNYIFEIKSQLRIITALLYKNALLNERTREHNLIQEAAATRLQALSRGYLTRKILREKAEETRSAAARLIQSIWRRHALVPWEIRSKRHLRTVAAASPRAPTQLPTSPTFSTCRSRARLTARRSIAFNQTREFWEVSTASPSAQLDHSRRRRSVFADSLTAPAPSLACLQRAVKSVAPLFAQVERPTPLPSPLANRDVSSIVDRSKWLNLVPKVSSVRLAAQSVDQSVKTPSRVLSSVVDRQTSAVRASRRALAGASPQKGDTSAQVVEYIAERQSSEKAASRFSFSQLLAPIDSSPSRNVTEYSDLLTLPLSSLSSSERLSIHDDENHPPVSEQPSPLTHKHYEREKETYKQPETHTREKETHTREKDTHTRVETQEVPERSVDLETHKDAGIYRHVVQSRRAETSKMGEVHSKPSAHRRGCSACSQKSEQAPVFKPVKANVPKDSRLSVRAWRRDEPIIQNEIARSSLLDGDLLLTTTVSTLDRDAPSTPLFGSRKVYEADIVTPKICGIRSQSKPLSKPPIAAPFNAQLKALEALKAFRSKQSKIPATQKFAPAKVLKVRKDERGVLRLADV